MTHIIAIANPKGGVGKTTTALSLAGALAEKEQDVLLIDLDPQAHLTLAMGINPEKVRRSIVDVLFGQASPYNAIRETRIPGIDILPSKPELVDGLLSMTSDTSQLKKAFSKGQLPAEKSTSEPPNMFLPDELAIYDWVFMDCPPSWNRILFNALTVADLFLIPTQPEYFSAYNLKILMGTVQQARLDNPNLAYRLLVTLLDPNNPIHAQLDSQIRDSFGSAVFDTTIHIDPKIPECAAAGLPINLFDADAQAAKQYGLLAQELASMTFASGSILPPTSS